MKFSHIPLVVPTIIIERKRKQTIIIFM